MRTTPLTLSLLVVSSLPGTTLAGAQEHRLKRSQLPAAVRATLDQEARGAFIKGFSTERENGKRVYEAQTVLNGHARDLQFAEDGRLMEVEEEVKLDSLSTPVQVGLKIQAAGATITKVESLSKQGKLVAFEASTLRGKKRGEVQVGPAGERLAHFE